MFMALEIMRTETLPSWRDVFPQQPAVLHGRLAQGDGDEAAGVTSSPTALSQCPAACWLRHSMGIINSIGKCPW